MDGTGYLPGPASANGFAEADGSMVFSVPIGADCTVQQDACNVTLTTTVTPNLQVSISDPYKESGSAGFNVDLSSPDLGTIYNYSKSITDGIFNTIGTDTTTFSVAPGDSIELNFKAKNEAAGQIPEPGTILLFGTGLLAFLRSFHRKLGECPV